MTNDSRRTKHRQPKTIQQTYKIQHDILSHITRLIPPKNIIILESPPLLYFDIFPYNNGSFLIAQKFGVTFAPTLVGEQQLWTDGIHVLNSARHLLVKSVAAAVAGIDPHRHYRLARPPNGAFGPWMRPFGYRPAPSRRPPIIHDHHWMAHDVRPTFNNVAAAGPFYFQRRRYQHPPGIRPLMELNIR